MDYKTAYPFVGYEHIAAASENDGSLAMLTRPLNCLANLIFSLYLREVSSPTPYAEGRQRCEWDIFFYSKSHRTYFCRDTDVRFAVFLVFSSSFWSSSRISAAVSKSRRSAASCIWLRLSLMSFLISPP